MEKEEEDEASDSLKVALFILFTALQRPPCRRPMPHERPADPLKRPGQGHPPSSTPPMSMSCSYRHGMMRRACLGRRWRPEGAATTSRGGGFQTWLDAKPLVMSHASKRGKRLTHLTPSWCPCRLLRPLRAGLAQQKGQASPCHGVIRVEGDGCGHWRDGEAGGAGRFRVWAVYSGRVGK